MKTKAKLFLCAFYSAPPASSCVVVTTVPKQEVLVQRPACLRLDHRHVGNSVTRRVPLQLVHAEARSTHVPRLVVVPEHRRVPRKAQLPRCGALHGVQGEVVEHRIVWFFGTAVQYSSRIPWLMLILKILAAWAAGRELEVLGSSTRVLDSSRVFF